MKDTIRTHWQITEAICANDPQKAYDSMYEHVSENSESIEIVRRMSCLLYTSFGRKLGLPSAGAMARRQRDAEHQRDAHGQCHRDLSLIHI